MKVCFSTNLDDVMRYEKFPDELPAVPSVGDYVESSTKWKNNIQVRLKVVSITWKQHLNFINNEMWYPEVKLHLSANYRCIADWENWYAKTRGKINIEEYWRRYEEISLMA